MRNLLIASIVVIPLMFSSHFPAGLKVDGSEQGAASKKEAMRLITSGQEVMSTGRLGTFRIYERLDGAKVKISYVRFDSQPSAERQFQEWVKTINKVSTRQNIKDEHGDVIGERIEAILIDRRSGENEYAILRRNGLLCSLIHSRTPTAAKQLEALMEGADD